ncbi:MAG: SPOR domain-containing protein [bacterium]|nr:SPOR domain-containing protein [bacterium]
MKQKTRLSVQRLILKWLDFHLGKLVLLSAILGLIAGVLFLVGIAKVTHTNVEEEVDLTEMQAETNDANSEIKLPKLTYYSELLESPKTKAAGNLAESEPAASEIPEFANEKVAEKNVPSSVHLVDTIAKVLHDETPENVEKMIAETLPGSTGSAFAIQIASFPQRASAENYLQDLTKKGFINLRLVQGQVAGRGIVYRVRIHGFASRAEAEKYRLQNKIEGFTVSQ